MRVLVVEDEMLLAMDYEAVLQGEGCTVMGPVPREAKAMALIERERPDAAILDLNLAGSRPVALAEMLSAARVPFIIVTGYGDKQQFEPVFCGAPRLHKPLRMETLVGTIAQIIRSG
jgi:DNA-binding response OmpR family regulator